MARKKTPQLDAPALITGYPGFITSRLVESLMSRTPKTDFTFVVQSQFAAMAREKLEAQASAHKDYSGKVHVVVGDITHATLGLDVAPYKALQKKIGVVWHLAAIYDLAVPEEAAYRVNVLGTKHVLDFCEGCKSFARLNYISTCYVAGQRIGRIFEDELDEGQTHNNHYESTKFWAEMEVQRRLDAVPSIIMRPSIVVGDSKTGETAKYDGPYYLLKFIKRMPKWAPFPRIGTADPQVNIVPVDFVVAAAIELALSPGLEGQVFQLADPHPMTASEIVDLSLGCLDRAPSKGVIPVGLVGAALRSDSMEEAIGMPREVVNYFTHDASYDTRNTDAALASGPVRCPHLSSYMQTLIDYFENFPDVEFLDHRRV